MQKKIFTEKGILIFILFVAFFSRSSSLGLFMWKNNMTLSEVERSEYPLVYDCWIYYNTAKNLAEGKGYSFTTTDVPKELPDYLKPSGLPNTYYQNFYPPIYSSFLSVLYRIFGMNILVHAVSQIILGTISCYFVYVIAKETFSVKVGLLACFLLAIYHPLVWWTSYIRSENLFIPLQLLTIIFLIRAIKNNLDLKNVIFAGILLAALFLCRNVALYLPIFIVIYFFVIFFKRDKKKLFYGSLIFLLSFYIPLLPWGYRNYTTYDKFTITTVEDWDAFYMLNNVQEADAPFFEMYSIKYDPKVDDSISATEKEKACKSFVKEHPLKYAKLCLKRVMAFWGPITKKPSFIKKILDTLIYIVVFPMAFYGFYKSKWWINVGAGFKPAPTLLITVILYYTLLHSAVSVDDALIYRYPIIPLICIFSAYGYYAYFTRNKKKQSTLHT